jgi:hypothetical protein
MWHFSLEGGICRPITKTPPTQKSTTETHIHPSSGIRRNDPNVQVDENHALEPDYCDQPKWCGHIKKIKSDLCTIQKWLQTETTIKKPL